MVLQLPQNAAQQPVSMAASPSSRVTTPQHATVPAQVLVMQGLSVSAAPAGIPVGSVLLSTTPPLQVCVQRLILTYCFARRLLTTCQ